MFLKKYNIYLIKNLLKYSCISIFLLSSVIWLTRSINYFEYITDYGLNLVDFIRITSSTLPNILVLILPICSFIATIVYYVRISQNNEIVILRNSGLSKGKLIIPSFMVGLIVCLFSYFVMFSLAPRADLAFERTISLLKRNFSSILLNSGDFRSFSNIKVYSRSRDNNKVKSLVISINDEKNGNKLVYSEMGEMVGDSFLKLYNGSIFLLNENNDYNNRTKTLFFDEYVIDIEDFLPTRNTNESSGNAELLKIRNLIKMKNKELKVVAEIAYKFLNPSLPLILSMVSAIMVLNINFSRSKKNVANLFIFAVNLLIFATFTYSYNLAKRKIFWFYIMILSIILPIIYIIIEIIRDDRRIFTR